MLQRRTSQRERQIPSVGQSCRSFAVRHPNARLVHPLWHPERCPGLSGLYAIINAIRLALADRHPLGPSELDRLIRAGFRFLNGRLSPEQATVCGLRVTLWHALTDALIAVAQAQTGVRIVTERLMVTTMCDRLAALDVLEQAITSLRVPMMLCGGGHYTVVRGFTRASVLLLDSGDSSWVARRSCGVPGDSVGRRHILFPSSFVALNV